MLKQTSRDVLSKDSINQSILDIVIIIFFFLSFAYNGCSLLPVIDIDECSASIPVCNVNANCGNTRGSYVCSCKAGFTGDGKACAGKSVLK